MTPEQRKTVIEALAGLLPVCGWANRSDDDLRLEHQYGNGAAAPILQARAALAILRADEQQEPPAVGIPAKEYLARIKQDPKRKAAMDRVKERFAASPVPVAQDEREATVEIHIPQYIGRAKSDKLVDAVCRAITKHDIEFTRVKLVHPDRAALSAATPPAAALDDLVRTSEELGLYNEPPAVSAEARDAARYRWLREVIGPGIKSAKWAVLMEHVSQEPDTPGGFDAAIDAAMGTPSAGEQK